MPPKIPSLLAIALVALAGAPSAAQRLGARTTSPETMVSQMDRGSPEEETPS